MLVNVVRDPTGQGFLNSTYGTPQQHTLDAFRMQHQAFQQSVAPYVTQDFLERTKAFHQIVSSNEAIEVGQRVVRDSMVAGVAPVFPVHTPEDFRAATKVMIDGIMTNPYLYDQYLRGNIDGFSETWVPVDSSMRVEHTHEYRMLHDGLAKYDHATGDLLVHVYEEERLPDEMLLTAVQRQLIVEAGNLAEAVHRQSGTDLTDTFVF